MGKNTYNDRAKRPPVFFEKLILVSVKLSIRCHIGSGMPYLCFFVAEGVALYCLLSELEHKE